jgi:CBS domain-containing protein
MSTLRTIMTSDVANVAPTMTARQAIDEMRTCHVPSAPVRSHGRVVGIVSSDDLALFLRRNEFETDMNRNKGARSLAEREIALSVHALLERVLVEDVMSPRVLALPPDTDSATAAEMMRHLGDRQVLVMEGDRLFGIVYEDDLVRASNERQ